MKLMSSLVVLVFCHAVSVETPTLFHELVLLPASMVLPRFHPGYINFATCLASYLILPEGSGLESGLVSPFSCVTLTVLLSAPAFTVIVAVRCSVVVLASTVTLIGVTFSVGVFSPIVTTHHAASLEAVTF